MDHDCIYTPKSPPLQHVLSADASAFVETAHVSRECTYTDDTPAIPPNIETREKLKGEKTRGSDTKQTELSDRLHLLTLNRHASIASMDLQTKRVRPPQRDGDRGRRSWGNIPCFFYRYRDRHCFIEEALAAQKATLVVDAYEEESGEGEKAEEKLTCLSQRDRLCSKRTDSMRRLSSQREPTA